MVRPHVPAFAALALLHALAVASPCALAAQGSGESGRRRSADSRSAPRQRYTIEQAISDKAQIQTAAFSALAFLTGDFGSATFLPPGKVADYFGFQYMRDIDEAGKGHNPMFLNRIAGNMLRALTDSQKERLVEAATRQEDLFRGLAIARWPLIHAFYRELRGKRPVGSAGLDAEQIKRICADLFEKDAELAYARAKVFGEMEASLAVEQRQEMASWKFGSFDSWPEISQEEARRVRPAGAKKGISVGVMTLASEWAAWRTGSTEADVYFCPERHGTYFGGFYMKDLPAIGKRDYDISTSITGDSGAELLRRLSPALRRDFEAVIEKQRPWMKEIVQVRRKMSALLRGFLAKETPSLQEARALGRRYGELDGSIAYEYVQMFVKIGVSLSAEQLEALHVLRNLPTNEDGSVFLYSQREAVPKDLNSDSLFLKTKAPATSQPGGSEEIRR